MQDHIMVWGRLTIPSSPSSWSPFTIIITFMNSHALSHYGLGTIIIIALWDDWEKYYQFQEPYHHYHLKVQELDTHWSKSRFFLSIVSWSRKRLNLNFLWKWKRGHSRMWQQWFLFLPGMEALIGHQSIRAHFKFSSWTWDWRRWWWWSLGIRTTYFCHTSFYEKGSSLLQILHHQVLLRISCVSLCLS